MARTCNAWSIAAVERIIRLLCLRDIHLAGGTPATDTPEVGFWIFAGQVNTFWCHLAEQYALQGLLGQVGRPGECHEDLVCRLYQWCHRRRNNYLNVKGPSTEAVTKRAKRANGGARAACFEQPEDVYSGCDDAKHSKYTSSYSKYIHSRYEAMFWRPVYPAPWGCLTDNDLVKFICTPTLSFYIPVGHVGGADGHNSFPLGHPGCPTGP